jgi:glutaredoxin-like YruB-family protein
MSGRLCAVIRTLVTSLLLALLVAGGSGCGVVKDSARQLLAKTLGEGAASLLGEDPAAAEEAAGAQGFSIAADETAAGEVHEEQEEEDDGSSFYKIVEPNGTVRFTSSLASLSDEQRARAERLKMAPSKPSAPRAAPAPKAKQLATAGASDQPPAARSRNSGGVGHEVTLYTTSWCGWCNKTRSWLDGKGIRYTDKDVERDSDAADEMRDLVGGDSGVPVVVIDGEVIRGFDQQRMKELLEI